MRYELSLNYVLPVPFASKRGVISPSSYGRAAHDPILSILWTKVHEIFVTMQGTPSTLTRLCPIVYCEDHCEKQPQIVIVAANDVLPLKAARRDATANLKCFGSLGTPPTYFRWLHLHCIYTAQHVAPPYSAGISCMRFACCGTTARLRSAYTPSSERSSCRG